MRSERVKSHAETCCGELQTSNQETRNRRMKSFIRTNKYVWYKKCYTDKSFVAEITVVNIQYPSHTLLARRNRVRKCKRLQRNRSQPANHPHHITFTTSASIDMRFRENVHNDHDLGMFSHASNAHSQALIIFKNFILIPLQQQRKKSTATTSARCRQ